MGRKCIGEKKITYRILMGNLKESDHLEYLGVDGTLIFKLILNEQEMGAWAGVTWVRIGRM
jgi:hypothetical protein